MFGDQPMQRLADWHRADTELVGKFSNDEDLARLKMTTHKSGLHGVVNTGLEAFRFDSLKLHHDGGPNP